LPSSWLASDNSSGHALLKQSLGLDAMIFATEEEELANPRTPIETGIGAGRSPANKNSPLHTAAGRGLGVG
jgi:hypothetical protein